MTDAFILGGVRTPVGRYGGSLARMRTDDLLGQTMVWACERVGVPFETSRPGVFAVGDVRAGSVKRVASAVGEGSMAIRMIHQYLALIETAG